MRLVEQAVSGELKDNHAAPMLSCCFPFQQKSIATSIFDVCLWYVTHRIVLSSSRSIENSCVFRFLRSPVDLKPLYQLPYPTDSPTHSLSQILTLSEYSRIRLPHQSCTASSPLPATILRIKSFKLALPRISTWSPVFGPPLGEKRSGS